MKDGEVVRIDLEKGVEVWTERIEGNSISEEVLLVQKNMKSGISDGLDGIAIELLKYLREVMVVKLIRLFNACLDDRKVP